ncbi:MAG: signal peptide peptidase SppA, partial [Solirubrobacteraceae bacterium]
GLIDGFGGLDSAIHIAARLAKISDYRITSLPEQKDKFQQIIESITGGSDDVMLKKELGDAYDYYMYIKNIKNMKGVQAVMPYL